MTIQEGKPHRPQVIRKRTDVSWSDVVEQHKKDTEAQEKVKYNYNKFYFSLAYFVFSLQQTKKK